MEVATWTMEITRHQNNRVTLEFWRNRIAKPPAMKRSGKRRQTYAAWSQFLSQ
jgi:hypothetical protein